MSRNAASWLTLAIVYSAIVLAAAPAFYLRNPEVKFGAVWQMPDVYAPFRFSVVDEASAENQRRRIEERHDKIFRHDISQDEASARQLSKLLDMVQAAAASDATTATDLQKRLLSELRVNVQPATAEILLVNTQNDRFRSDLSTILQHFNNARGMTTDKGIFNAAARAGRFAFAPGAAPQQEITTISAETLLGYPDETFYYLDQRYLPGFAVSDEVKGAYSDIMRQILRPNIFHDREMTENAKRDALRQTQSQVFIEQGQRILTYGERISPLKAALFKRLAETARAMEKRKAAGIAFIAALAVLGLFLYLRKYNPEVSFDPRHILLIGLPVITALALGRLIVRLGEPADVGIYAFPAALVGMLGVILFDPRLGLMLVAMSSLLFGAYAGADGSCMIVSMAGGFAGVASLYSIKERKQVLMAGILVAVVNVLVIGAVGFLDTGRGPSLATFAGGAANGVVCYALALGALPLFEALFGVSTDVRLMELTSTHHPLVRQLEDKAPGTYQHMLNVAKMAESAADAVGANALLTRTGAYFHDIGKALKPKYFTENQVTPEERRIHSRLSPNMSSLIIKKHVTDGIDLAHRHHLPERVTDFIPQHHGTALIKYFYAEALKRTEPNIEVSEEEFRYPGPKPQTIEAAIVMLADTVDAMATAKLSGKTVREEDVRKLVREAINDKFHDGQFDECHMTFRDLFAITESFVRTLLSRFHHRVDYPAMPQKREVRGIAPEPAASTK